MGPTPPSRPPTPPPAGRLEGPGTNASAPAVGTGSHTDAIPLAGAYDGTLGVIGGIAALKALKDAGFVPGRPVEVGGRPLWRGGGWRCCRRSRHPPSHPCTRPPTRPTPPQTPTAGGDVQQRGSPTHIHTLSTFLPPPHPLTLAHTHPTPPASPPPPLEVVMFNSEEPTRYGLSCSGSRAMAGHCFGEYFRNAIGKRGSDPF